VDEGDNPLINVAVNFQKKKKYVVEYTVEDTNGKTLLPVNNFIFKEAMGAGKELALRIFGVNGPAGFEHP
jgi:hypothetical protein